MFTLGLILNSHSCVLSYNNFDFEMMMKTVNSRNEVSSGSWHKETFLKQFCYNVINLTILTRY